MHCKQIKLGDVWRTCNKIRAAIFRMGINLFDYFKPLDIYNNCLISESQFISVIHGQLGSKIGLSEQEVAELADYFRVPDGRIYYTQLCDVINDSVPVFSENSPLTTGLEWNDPMHTNRLSMSEERRLSVLLTKMTTLINMKKMILRPYFQDYELVSKNTGAITIAHFARILAYLNIILSADDFNLLVKKYLKDGYTINYIAFLASIDEILQYLDQHGMLDLSGDVMALFPGRVINAELPKLPRPEIGRILASRLFGKQTIFHPALEEAKKTDHIRTTIARIQEHVLRNRLRINEFFKHFDILNSGRISVDQFHRGLDSLALNGKQRFFLSLPDVEAVINQYRDPCDTTRVCWRVFEDDIDHVFTIKELEKTPSILVDTPPENVKSLPKVGGRDWQNVTGELRHLCEETMYKIKQQVLHRRILLKPIFKDFDKHNNGHVTRNQVRQALNSNGMLLSDEELFSLEERFNNDMGFNYFWFLKEIEAKDDEEPLFTNYLENMKRLNSTDIDIIKRKPTKQEKDIVQILAKIKGKLVRERVRVLDFMKQYDKHNEQILSKDNFRRALTLCQFDLSYNEIETIMEVFASPLRRCNEYVDYRRFCDVIEEAFTQPCLEKTPLIVPVQHLPIKDCEKQFLNFDERLILSVAMQKLSKKPDLQINLSSVIQDFDKTNCGTISKTKFLKALTTRGMNNLISSNEFDMICKCFSFERGMHDEVDYRGFLKALDILHATDKYNPF